MIDKIIEEIKQEKLVQKYLIDYTWLSGSSTLVYPIEVYRNNRNNTIEITIQIKTKRNYFKGLLNKYSKYNNYLKGWFSKTDDSCPSELKLIFKGEII